MADNIFIEKYDEVYVRCYTEPGISYELQEYFTFEVPGARFMPQVRNKFWDGKIRLYNPSTGLIYAGLVPYIREFAKNYDYTVEVDDELHDVEFPLAEATSYAKDLLKGAGFEPRDYQLKAFAHAMRTKRALMLSPTASGKSLIIYLIAHMMQEMGNKILVIVPTTSLVYQMQTDFKDYGFEKDVRVIDGSQNKSWRDTISEGIVISTWQSIHKMPKPWFAQFKCVIGDEAHHFKSKSLTTIMTKLVDCPYRFGFTGTIDETQTHKLVLEGLFGSIKKVTTTSELMEKGTLSKLGVKAIVLKHPGASCDLLKKATYQDELQHIVGSPARNKFIQNLVTGLNGNTLLLYQLVEKHGKILYNNILEQQQKEVIDRNIFFVSGEVDAAAREQIRALVESDTDAIIVASYGTFSTGINIKNLHNVVFASPSKSKIRVLQSIGRGLRRSDTKSNATLFDIADDLTHKSRKNYTLKHFQDRVQFYNDEKFDYKIYQVKLNGV